MRILVLGATGMLGHKLMQTLSADHEVTGTVRSEIPSLLQGHRILKGVQAGDFPSITRAFAEARPEAVINCVGLIKQLHPSRSALVEINAMFPHRLAELCQAASARLVHLSTDCVFSGEKGRYTEESRPDPVDDYGLSKLLGEITEGGLTLRTSIIGREIASASGLIEWFYSQRGKTVKGFRKAIYTGLTTLETGRVIKNVLENYQDLSGVWHLSSEPIDKFDLLRRVSDAAGLGITVEPQDEFICDRSMLSDRFRKKTGYTPPTWDAMIEEMARDGESYDTQR